MIEDSDKYIGILKEWVIQKKISIYNEVLNKETGKSTDLLIYYDEINKLGYELLNLTDSENTMSLLELGWSNELIESIRDPSINLIIRDFIEMACLRYPSTNGIDILDDLKNKNKNAGLE